MANLGGAPWTVIDEATLAGASQCIEPTATNPSSLKVAKGFEVELLYTVPKEAQGSRVSMTVDPKGRLIVSDQYGKLYRLTPAPIGDSAKPTKIEPIGVKIGEAQRITRVFDGLYFVVNDGLYFVVNEGATYPSGLYRVRDTDGDDHLDTVESLRPLNGGGEHGPHAVIPGPDGKSLYVVAGNANRLTELAGSLVPGIWDEDQILPHLLDGRGFMRDERAPGGCIYRVSPDGKKWDLVSMGYRNPYDLAFNAQGDLSTYDSNIEWDFNTPWYRSARICQADSGSDFGYRNGSGKCPTYYPENLSPTLNIGPVTPARAALAAPVMPAEELYDLNEEPYEVNNLADSLNPERLEALDRLRAEFGRWIEGSERSGADRRTGRGRRGKGGRPKPGPNPKTSLRIQTVESRSKTGSAETVESRSKTGSAGGILPGPLRRPGPPQHQIEGRSEPVQGRDQRLRKFSPNLVMLAREDCRRRRRPAASARASSSASCGPAPCRASA